jgi:mannose-6-phosphate isomerase-like protein (cupin superfamily)
MMMKHLPRKPDEDEVSAYLLGSTSRADELLVERYAATDAEFADTLDRVRTTMETSVSNSKVTPPASAKSKLFERPEIVSDPVGKAFPPYINAYSTIEEFRPWFVEAMVTMAQNATDFEILPIGASEDTFTFLAKMCSSIPEEVHVTELERLLLVEGFCDFVVGDNVHHFGPGDHYSIPIYTPHSAYVTSPNPCFFIVQRTVL